MAEFWSEDRQSHSACVITSTSAVRLTVALVGLGTSRMLADISPTLNGFVASATSDSVFYPYCSVASSLGWSVLLSPPDSSRVKRPVDEYQTFGTTVATTPSATVVSAAPVTGTSAWATSLVPNARGPKGPSRSTVALVSVFVVLIVCLLGLVAWIAYKRYATRSGDKRVRSKAYARGSTIKNSFRRVIRKEYV